MEDTHNQQRFEFLNVIARGQTYLNIIYLLLAFPLGLAYFIFLVVGLSVGVGLLIIWVGIPILLLTLLGWWGCVLFERSLANAFLDAHLSPLSPPVAREVSLWERLRSHLANPLTWKGLIFLIAKFPLGLLSFITVVVLFSVTGGMLAAPFVYDEPLNYMDFGVGVVDSMGEAILIALLGVIVGILSLHLMNLLAQVWAKFTEYMLTPTP